MTALIMVSRTVTASCIHRKLNVRSSPDGISWSRWAEETQDMAVLYLTQPAQPRHR